MVPAILAISDGEYAIHRRPQWCRWAWPHAYPLDPHSRRPVTEFVELADRARRAGLGVIPLSRLDDARRGTAPVLKFGPSDAHADATLLEHHDTHSEWNLGNVTKPSEYSRHIDLGRQTWNLLLSAPEHRERLRELFAAHGRLFVKTVAKGYSRVYSSHDEFVRDLGDLDRLAEESLDVLVSEVIGIRHVPCRSVSGPQALPDEWRHYVYRQRRVASAFHACDASPVEAAETASAAHVATADAVIAALRATDFATSYVLDTAMREDGTVVVIETNSLFSSGLFTTAAIQALVDAIACG